MLGYFDKPEYVYRPRQALRRLIQLLHAEPSIAEITLPWGLQISVRPNNGGGRSIWSKGIHDLPLTEAIWRLLDAGETAVDVGANIGYVTGLMAVRSGRRGRVVAFEPHPGNYAALSSHLARWRDQVMAPIGSYEIALSIEKGLGVLEEPPGFASNCGLARIKSNGGAGGRDLTGIVMARLDEILRDTRIGLLKVDVEGHELKVFSGARGLLCKGLIRDIVFEEHSRSFSSASASMLAGYGYTIFALSRSLTGPALARGNELSKLPRLPMYLPPNFLATTDPERAIARLRRRGWRCLESARQEHSTSQGRSN